jgi:hypothetical protein
MQANAQMSGTSAAQKTKAARQKVAKRKIRRQRDTIDRDVARLPDGWQQEQPMWQRNRPMWQRDQSFGLAFARPFSW